MIGNNCDNGADCITRKKQDQYIKREQKDLTDEELRA